MLFFPLGIHWPSEQMLLCCIFIAHIVLWYMCFKLCCSITQSCGLCGTPQRLQLCFVGLQRRLNAMFAFPGAPAPESSRSLPNLVSRSIEPSLGARWLTSSPPASFCCCGIFLGKRRQRRLIPLLVSLSFSSSSLAITHTRFLCLILSSDPSSLFPPLARSSPLALTPSSHSFLTVAAPSPLPHSHLLQPPFLMNNWPKKLGVSHSHLLLLL